MKTNVGTLDRTVRIALGLVLLAVGAAALAGVVSLGVIPMALALAVGAILTFTGVLRTCPIYRLFGFDTCPVSGRPG
jgi:NhaP-type Na+/H+ or K+/H+ antiporter